LRHLRGRWSIIGAVQLLIITLGLVAACFGVVQFCYLMFQQATIRQQQRRIAELERELVALHHARGAQPASVEAGAETAEVWSELIDDGAG
jgi:Tfp pilus assembly protein PilN